METVGEIASGAAAVVFRRAVIAPKRMAAEQTDEARRFVAPALPVRVRGTRPTARLQPRRFGRRRFPS
jgi:hypothetical protein